MVSRLLWEQELSGFDSPLPDLLYVTVMRNWLRVLSLSGEGRHMWVRVPSYSKVSETDFRILSPSLQTGRHVPWGREWLAANLRGVQFPFGPLFTGG